MRSTILLAGGIFILLVFGFIGKAQAGISGRSDIDHYKCYEAEEETPTIEEVRLVDQFTDRTYTTVKVQLFCNPVSKDGGEILNALAHLTCYKIEDEDDVVRQVLMGDQFGPNRTIEVEETELLCLPTSKGSVMVEQGDDDDDDDDD